MDEINIEMSRDAALVLFEWLVRFNSTGAAHFVDRSEQRVVWDLEAALEAQLEAPLAPSYQPLLEAARATVRDSTGRTDPHDRDGR